MLIFWLTNSNDLCRRTLSLLLTHIFKWLNINAQWQIGRGRATPTRGSYENSWGIVFRDMENRTENMEHNEAALELPHQVGLFISRGRRRSSAQFIGFDLLCLFYFQTRFNVVYIYTIWGASHAPNS